MCIAIFGYIKLANNLTNPLDALLVCVLGIFIVILFAEVFVSELESEPYHLIKTEQIVGVSDEYIVAKLKNETNLEIAYLRKKLIVMM